MGNFLSKDEIPVFINFLYFIFFISNNVHFPCLSVLWSHTQNSRLWWRIWEYNRMKPWGVIHLHSHSLGWGPHHLSPDSNSLHWPPCLQLCSFPIHFLCCYRSCCFCFFVFKTHTFDLETSQFKSFCDSFMCRG